VRRAVGVTLDTSVWVPYLRPKRYASAVDPLVGAGRVWVHGIALLELYAGTASVDDARAVDTLREAARSLGRLYVPPEHDLVLAGRVLAYHARRYGRLRPRDHSHDLLIAIGAARTGSILLTVNRRDMDRWAAALRRRAGLRVQVASPAV
jgi:predicted nucleic acid-binding protein